MLNKKVLIIFFNIFIPWVLDDKRGGGFEFDLVLSILVSDDDDDDGLLGGGGGLEWES